MDNKLDPTPVSWPYCKHRPFSSFLVIGMKIYFGETYWLYLECISIRFLQDRNYGRAKKSAKWRGMILRFFWRKLRTKNTELSAWWRKSKEGEDFHWEREPRRNCQGKMCKEFSVEISCYKILTFPDDAWNLQLNYPQQNSITNVVWFFFVKIKEEAEILQQDGRRIRTAGGGGKE